MVENQNHSDRDTNAGEPELCEDLSVFQFDAEEIEKALLTGEHAGVLEDYYGQTAYAKLRELSLKAAATTKDGRRPRVLILPGITGSQLGPKRGDVVWLDPHAIQNGRIMELSLDSGINQSVLGVMPGSYDLLKASLIDADFNADFYAYDWRLGIDELGAQLALHLDSESADEISLVCHSMGGMVARAAIKQMNGRKLGRLIMLGTPNYGSFTIPRSICGQSDTVKFLASTDDCHTAYEIADQVINTFTGLYHMMPSREKYDRVDLYHRAKWPQTGPLPRQNLLDGIETARESMADADERFFLIAGVDQDTRTDLEKVEDEFMYSITTNGDGAVPVDFARLPGAQTYYVKCKHKCLPKFGSVLSAVEDILKKGSTSALPGHWEPVPQTAAKIVPESVSGVELYEGRKGSKLSQSEIRANAKQILQSGIIS